MQYRSGKGFASICGEKGDYTITILQDGTILSIAQVCRTSDHAYSGEATIYLSIADWQKVVQLSSIVLSRHGADMLEEELREDSHCHMYQE